MLKAFNTTLIALIFAGALAAQTDCSITERRDKFYPGQVVYEGTEIVIFGKISWPTYCFFKPCRFVQDGAANGEYYWNFYYAGEDWMFFTGMILLLDGKAVEVQDPDPRREIGESSMVFEAISCPITERISRSIATAESVSVRFVATRGRGFDHDFDSIELDCIRRFQTQTELKSR
jgi:hypothetical protein